MKYGRKKTKGWSEERRKTQAENIRRTKPWLKSTGPKTAEGKARVSRNSYKHGNHSQEFREIHRILAQQRRFVIAVNRLVREKERALKAWERGDKIALSLQGEGWVREIAPPLPLGEKNKKHDEQTEEIKNYSFRTACYGIDTVKIYPLPDRKAGFNLIRMPLSCMKQNLFVTPAQAGAHLSAFTHAKRWIPAFAVMTFFFLISVPVLAQPVAIDNGIPITIPASATMNNSFTIELTDIDFGAVALTAASGQSGELIMETDGTLDETTGNNDPVARIVANLATGQQGVLDVESGLPDTLLTLRYSNVQNLTCVAGCAGLNPDIIVSRINDDMPDQAGLWSVDDADPDGDAVPGQGMTDGTGAIVIQIGAALRTEDTNTPYQSGDYEGSFDVTLEY